MSSFIQVPAWHVFAAISEFWLNEPTETDKLIKLANKFLQRHIRDKNGKDNNKSYIWNQETNWIFEA